MALKFFDDKDLLDKPVKKDNEQKIIITDIKQAIKNQNRVNIFINGKYGFSLDIFQVSTLKLKIGSVLSKEDVLELEQQSEFGKLYVLALNYCLMRPHSEKEIRDYLWRKTFPKKIRNRKTGELYEKKGVSQKSVEQVMARLKDKEYIDDEKFALFWVEHRNSNKGISIRKLRLELSNKGVSNDIQNRVLEKNIRNDSDEIKKIIEKKLRRYPDKQKFITYLMRQGFSFDEILKNIDDYYK